MRFPVAFGLRCLIEPLPLRALFHVLLVYRLAGERFNDRKHPAVAEIAVVRDGKHAATGLLLVVGHPFPQLTRIIAAERGQSRERYDLARFIAVVAEDD